MKIVSPREQEGLKWKIRFYFMTTLIFVLLCLRVLEDGFNPTILSHQSSETEDNGKLRSDNTNLKAVAPAVANRPAPGSDPVVGPDVYGSGCPADCGCPRTPRDCPHHYNPQDVLASALESNPVEAERWTQVLQEAREKAKQTCSQQKTAQATGGWCLTPKVSIDENKPVYQVRYPDGTSYPMAVHHVSGTGKIVQVLSSMIETEGIQSITDFGAVIGQCKVTIRSKYPQVEYFAYDGAGNIGEKTHNKVEYIDLTLPLTTLPVLDWVLSLEVGEHILSKYEGRFIHNLH